MPLACGISGGPQGVRLQGYPPAFRMRDTSSPSQTIGTERKTIGSAMRCGAVQSTLRSCQPGQAEASITQNRLPSGSSMMT